MSIKVMSQIWATSTHKGSALLLLLAIADHAHDDGGGAYPSVETLAAKIRMGKRNVMYLLKTLEKSGELTTSRDSGPNGANLYQINIVQSLHVQSPIVQSLHVQNPTPLSAIPCKGMVQSHVSLSATAVAPKPSLEPSLEPLVRKKVERKKVHTFQELDITSKDRLLEKFRSFWPDQDIEEKIDLALCHTAAKKYTNHYLYLKNWLQRDAERMANNGEFKDARSTTAIDSDAKWASVDRGIARAAERAAKEAALSGLPAV